MFLLLAGSLTVSFVIDSEWLSSLPGLLAKGRLYFCAFSLFVCGEDLANVLKE